MLQFLQKSNIVMHWDHVIMQKLYHLSQKGCSLIQKSRKGKAWQTFDILNVYQTPIREFINWEIFSYISIKCLDSLSLGGYTRVTRPKNIPQCLSRETICAKQELSGKMIYRQYLLWEYAKQQSYHENVPG